jgi:hypothetical protein
VAWPEGIVRPGCTRKTIRAFEVEELAVAQPRAQQRRGSRDRHTSHKTIKCEKRNLFDTVEHVLISSGAEQLICPARCEEGWAKADRNENAG